MSLVAFIPEISDGKKLTLGTKIIILTQLARDSMQLLETLHVANLILE